MSRHEVRQGSFGRARHALLTKSLTQPLPWWDALGRCMKTLHLEHLHSHRSWMYIYIYTLHKYIYYISLYILYTWYIMIPKSTTASKNKSTSTPNNCKQVPGSTNKQIIPKLDEYFHQNTLVAPSVCSDAVPPSTDSSNQRPDHQVEYSHQPGRRHPLKGSQSKASEKQQRLIPMNKNWWTVMKHGNVFV